jgi:glycosyltransferase involved in cell wall biosynthesis
VDCGKPTGKWSYRNKWHQIYNKRLSKHLAKCARLDGKPEIIASIYGAAQSDIETFGLPVIEAMVGYDHCWAPYRVFPSYAHQHTIYAQQPDFTAKNRFFDTVIPHFLDDTQYWPSSNPLDYLLFIGRNAPGKGLAVAQQAAEKTGLELKVVHNGCFGAAKTELLANARAVLMPTLYVEPFGYVAIEAQMCGTPIITTDWGAFAETVLHGLTGFRCRTQAEFVAAIRKTPRLDRNFIRDYALNHFSIKKIAPKYKAYFDFVWNVHKNGGYYADAAFRDATFL